MPAEAISDLLIDLVGQLCFTETSEGNGPSWHDSDDQLSACSMKDIARQQWQLMRDAVAWPSQGHHGKQEDRKCAVCARVQSCSSECEQQSKLSSASVSDRFRSAPQLFAEVAKDMFWRVCLSFDQRPADRRNVTAREAPRSERRQQIIVILLGQADTLQSCFRTFSTAKVVLHCTTRLNILPPQKQTSSCRRHRSRHHQR
jgi:hypothetical protein